jgi:hypothetical protein
MGPKTFAVQLKKRYHTISTLEDKVKQHNADDSIRGKESHIEKETAQE